MNYMSHPLSVRLNDSTIARLGRHAQRAHLAPRTLAQRCVEEGLRTDEHPLIRFADGPAGRRARLAGTGKDAWEIIAAVRDNDGDAAVKRLFAATPSQPHPPGHTARWLQMETPPPSTIPPVPPARTPGTQLPAGQLAIGGCRTSEAPPL